MRPQPRDDAPAAHQYASQDERDQALEMRYSYDRRGERSTLAFVNAHADDLVAEYFTWRRGQIMAGREDVGEAVQRWERERFGNVLDPGAHGALLFSVRWALAPSDGGRYHPPSYADHPEWLKRRAQLHGPMPRNLERAASRALPDMPDRPTRRKTDARLVELEAQAEAIGGAK